MKDDSCCDSSPVAMTLACSGGSNVGQITNEVGLENYDYVVVTDLGIEKKRDFELPDAEIDKVLSVCREKLSTASASKED